jgi:hypothetical protein
MNTQAKQIKHILEFYPQYRERKNKNELIAKMLIKSRSEGGTELSRVTYKVLEDLIVEAGSLDRIWRQVLQRNPKYRGSDYEDRKKLVKEKQFELGYIIN